MRTIGGVLDSACFVHSAMRLCKTLAGGTRAIWTMTVLFIIELLGGQSGFFGPGVVCILHCVVQVWRNRAPHVPANSWGGGRDDSSYRPRARFLLGKERGRRGREDWRLDSVEGETGGGVSAPAFWHDSIRLIICELCFCLFPRLSWRMPKGAAAGSYILASRLL